MQPVNTSPATDELSVSAPTGGKAGKPEGAITVTTTETVAVSPIVTVAGISCTAVAVGRATTARTAADVLLAPSGSAVSDVPCAVSVTGPLLANRSRARVALAPGPRLAICQSLPTSPPVLGTPGVSVPVPPASARPTLTLAAVSGPLFVTVTVKGAELRARTVADGGVTVTPRSATPNSPTRIGS